jgi:hypothetical protein
MFCRIDRRIKSILVRFPIAYYNIIVYLVIMRWKITGDEENE